MERQQLCSLRTKEEKSTRPQPVITKDETRLGWPYIPTRTDNQQKNKTSDPLLTKPPNNTRRKNKFRLPGDNFEKTVTDFRNGACAHSSPDRLFGQWSSVLGSRLTRRRLSHQASWPSKTTHCPWACFRKCNLQLVVY